MKGAAGSLVAKNLVPYKFASYLRLAFSKEILQVSESYVHLLLTYLEKNPSRPPSKRWK